MEFKLEELANIALGAPSITNVNIAVLQSLMGILLKKLNCQNEPVFLSTFESEKLQKILKKSQISPLAFNDENVEMVVDKLQHLEILQQTVSELEKKLSCHLEQVQSSNNFADSKLEWENWQNFGTEDFCTVCNPDNDVACKLLKNTDFLKKLLRRLSSPMVERVFHLEDKLKMLQQEFNQFIARAEDEYAKIQLLETCIYEIELLRKKINENQTQFICIMEEVQEMLDAKLDKIHTPALKKYIRDGFQRITQDLQNVHAREECPRAAGIIIQGLRCLSCGSANVSSNVGVHSMAMLPDAKPKQKLTKHCKKPQTINDHPSVKQSLEFEVKSLKKGKCGNKYENVQFIKGLDGNLYRSG
ncbi:uncharacterized protein LOC142233893 [Haematobia irritans]|uniref:uncharacterized protein LOC142233893 n=1 Tax=Haematobia irritans TaxID=7368 RepID=UPI003F502D60